MLSLLPSGALPRALPRRAPARGWHRKPHLGKFSCLVGTRYRRPVRNRRTPLRKSALRLRFGRQWYITYEEYHPYGTSAYRAEGAAIGVSRRRYRYTGKERDEETGLYYHGARYYAAWLGRWTAADPSGLIGGANLYQYVSGNPIALMDPDGRDSNFDFTFSGMLDAAEKGIQSAVSSNSDNLQALAGATTRLGRRAIESLHPTAPLNAVVSLAQQQLALTMKMGEQLADGDLKGGAFTALKKVMPGLSTVENVLSKTDPFEAAAASTDFGIMAGSVAGALLAPFVKPPPAPTPKPTLKPKIRLKPKPKFKARPETPADLAQARPPYGAPSPPGSGTGAPGSSPSGGTSGPIKAPTDLHAFGNKTRPRPPRIGKDLAVDPAGRVNPTSPPEGASTFGDPNQAPLTGHYHKVPAGTPLPEGVGVRPDGVDVGGSHPSTHHTIYPTQPMTFSQFVDKFLSLPWQYGGKKK